MRIDWEEKLRHMLQVFAFCLVIATVQYGFQPDKPYGPPVVYSLFIGTTVWAIVDIGRELFPSSRDTGWPRGMSGVLLVVGAIVIGWLLGSKFADFVCQQYGLYPQGYQPHPQADLRNSILITVMAGIAGSYYFYSASRSGYLERKMTEATRHANEARLKLLETQLEPHMLFNTLANLRALIAVDPVRAQQMLDHMISYLRATLDGSRAPSHPLQAEFERLRDYLELMAIRMGRRLTFTLDLPGDLAQHPVPTLLLHPLVENSIRHGLEPKVEGGEVRVGARREGDDVVIEVRDTGIGADAGEATDAKGFGLRQVRERLASLYGPRAGLEFAAMPDGGCRVRVRYPIES